MTTQLSPHFVLEEFEATSIHADNTAPPGAVLNLQKVAATLERIRALLGDHPITITSGYRSPAVNSALGGAKDSAHLLGYAADFVCPDFGPPLAICQKIQTAGIAFDQLINEGVKPGHTGWVHISVAPAMRLQTLTADFASGDARYTEGLG